MDRNEAISRIKKALQQRSGKTWSVTGGRGTAWGWLKIDAPPRRCVFESDGVTPCHSFGVMSKADREELSKLLGTDVHHQGESVPHGNDFYQEFVDRAEGREPTAFGKADWD
jgi:hypothetical protein